MSERHEGSSQNSFGCLVGVTAIFLSPFLLVFGIWLVGCPVTLGDEKTVYFLYCVTTDRECQPTSQWGYASSTLVTPMELKLNRERKEVVWRRIPHRWASWPHGGRGRMGVFVDCTIWNISNWNCRDLERNAPVSMNNGRLDMKIPGIRSVPRWRYQLTRIYVSFERMGPNVPYYDPAFRRP